MRKSFSSPCIGIQAVELIFIKYPPSSVTWSVLVHYTCFMDEADLNVFTRMCTHTAHKLKCWGGNQRQSWKPTLFPFHQHFSKQALSHNISVACVHVCSVAQWYLTLCDPVDYSPPCSSSMGFPRQESWSGLPFPSPSLIRS